MEKKEIARFSPRFNLCDPAQKKAAEFLSVQGKYMAQYITNAVLHYESCPNLGTATIDYHKLATMISSELSSVLGESQPMLKDDTDKKDSFLLDGLDAFQ